MKYIEEIEEQLDLIEWSELDEETKQLIMKLGEENDL